MQILWFVSVEAHTVLSLPKKTRQDDPQMQFPHIRQSIIRNCCSGYKKYLPIGSSSIPEYYGLYFIHNKFSISQQTSLVGFLQKKVQNETIVLIQNNIIIKNHFIQLRIYCKLSYELLTKGQLVSCFNCLRENKVLRRHCSRANLVSLASNY